MNAAAPKTQLRVVPGAAKPDPIFGGRPSHELEFLPAALEVMETPPPPLPRVMMLTLAALLVIALGWAGLSRIDVVSTATGRLTPVGGGKVVQPLETGTVTAIHVRDGTIVRKGDVLVELEPTDTLADQQRLASELAAAELDVARLKAVALGQPFRAPSGADAAAVAIAEREARAEIADRTAKAQNLGDQADEHRAEVAGARAEAERLRTLIPLAQQRSAVFEDLERQGYGSQLQLIEAHEKQQDTERSLAVQNERIPQYQAQISAAEKERAQVLADSAKTDLAALSDAEVKAASLTEELRKARERLSGRTLTAPVDGVVQELAIHTVGGVVEPGQTLMRVAPSGAGVEVEAKLANKDVGFVRVGMPAEIKVETFPFTRYGVIHATVVNVSSDAISDPQSPQRPQGEPSGQAQPSGAGDLQYLVRLLLARDTMNIDGRTVRLTPGMMVTAEIKTGRRRVIEFLLSPLAKATSEAGHER
jgi:hemolysin D